MSLTCGGIFNLINATGRIKWFKLNTSVFFIACIPLGYVLFDVGYPAYSILLLFLGADIIQRGVQLRLMHRLLDFDSWRYAREAYGRPAIIAIIAAAGLYAHSFVKGEGMIAGIMDIAVCFVLIAALIYTIGLTNDERIAIKRTVKARLSK